MQGETPPPLEEDPIVGMRFGNFRAVERIGSGGFASVYRGKNVFIPSSEVAIKILNFHQRKDPSRRQRFHREAEIIANLDHPNIIRLVDFGSHERGFSYLVMDYFEGRTLSHHLQRAGAMPAAWVFPVVMEICAGLAHAHRLGVIHRDLKPSNIFLATVPGNKTQVKLIDFGIASLAEKTGSLTRTGTTMGSPSYMAPEQAAGDWSRVDPRSDLYSVGVLLFRMLAGVKPFDGKNAFELMLKHTEHPAPSLKEKKPDHPWSEELEALVQRAMAKAPEQRPSNATEFWQECAVALEAQLHVESNAFELEDLPTYTVLPTLPSLPRKDDERTEALLLPPEHTLGTEISPTLPISIQMDLDQDLETARDLSFLHEYTAGRVGGNGAMAGGNLDLDTVQTTAQALGVVSEHPLSPPESLPAPEALGAPPEALPAPEALPTERGVMEAMEEGPPTELPRPSARGQARAMALDGFVWGGLVAGCAFGVLLYLLVSALQPAPSGPSPRSLPPATPAPKLRSQPIHGVSSIRPFPRRVPEASDLWIETAPSGAAVWLDGRPQGRTPTRIRVRPGQRLRLHKKGYRPREVLLRWKDGQTALRFPLTRNRR